MSAVPSVESEDRTKGWGVEGPMDLATEGLGVPPAIPRINETSRCQ